MKQICKTLGMISLVAGVIGSFVLAYAGGATLSISRYGTLENERNWLLTIIYFLVGLVCISAVSAILLGISEILERLESIDQVQDVLVQNTQSDVEDKVPQNYWKCPNCGKANPPYTGTCGCGQLKP